MSADKEDLGDIVNRDWSTESAPISVTDSPSHRAADSADSAGSKIPALVNRPSDPGSGKDERTSADAGQQREQESDVERLLALASNAQLFHTPGDVAYATVEVSGHRETHAVRGRSFRGWLLHQYYRRYQDAPSGETVQQASRVLEARARFDGECEEVFVRVGEKNHRIYIDLGDPRWRAVEIDAEGWRVVERSAVRFRRPSGLLALPEPVHGGSLDELRPFVNLSAEDDWVLFGGSLIAALRPRGPHFITEFGGEQGTGKSTAARMFRDLVDPSRAPVRSEPREERDLMIAAANSWCVAFDNLSHLARWLSDALCRLSTGGGFSTRQLYTDDDEVIFDAQRPVLLTSIEAIVVRGDLLDRTISLQLLPVASASRRTEQELWQAFEAARPRILGALYDAISSALSWLATAQNTLANLPRMADAVVWVTAAEPALDWPFGTFKGAFERQSARLSLRAVEADVLGSAIVDLLDSQPSWTGTATELLKLLVSRTTPHLRCRLPANAASLGQKLRRLRPDLRAQWVEVTDNREGHESTRTIRLGRTEPAVRAVGADRKS